MAAINRTLTSAECSLSLTCNYHTSSCGYGDTRLLHYARVSCYCHDYYCTIDHRAGSSGHTYM